MSDTFWFCFTFLITNYLLLCKYEYCELLLNVNCVIFVQREEKEDYAAEAFVSEHGSVLARKVSQPCFHHLH